MIIGLNGVISYLPVKTNQNKTEDLSIKIPLSVDNLNVNLYRQKRQQYNPSIGKNKNEKIITKKKKKKNNNQNGRKEC